MVKRAAACLRSGMIDWEYPGCRMAKILLGVAPLLTGVLFLSYSEPARAQSGTPITMANADFEAGNFSSWRTRAAETAPTYEVVPGGVTGSNWYAKMLITSSSSTVSQQAVYLSRSDFPTAPGWYRLTFYMQTDLTQGVAGAYLTVGGVQVASPGQAGMPIVSGRTAWTLYSIVYQITTTSTVTLQLQGTSARGTISLDKLTVEKTPSPEVLTNSGFESGAFSPWAVRAPVTGDSAGYSIQSGSPEGTSYGQITITPGMSSSVKAAACLLQNTLPTAAGYYRISYWMKTDLYGGVAGAYIFGMNSANQVLVSLAPGKSGNPAVVGTTGWAQYTFVYQLPANVTKTVLQLQLDNGLHANATGSVSSTVGFDKVIVEAIPATEGTAAIFQQTAGADTIENICGPAIKQPCAITHPMKGALYADPVNGHPMLIMNSCTNPQGSAVFVDYNTPNNPVTTATVFPAGSGGWDFLPTLNQQFVFESLGTPQLNMIQVDKVTKSVVHTTPSLVNPVNLYAWKMAEGNDGMIYHGAYPVCRAYRYSPSTRTTTDLGSMDVDYNGSANTIANSYVRHIGVTGSSNASYDGWVLSTILGSTNASTAGVVAWKANTAGYPKMVQGTKTFTPTLQSVRNTATSERIIYAWGFPDGRALQQFDPAQMKFTNATLPPASLPAAPNGGIWNEVLPSSTADKLIILSSGNYYKVQGSTVTLVFNKALLKSSGALVGIDGAGNLVGYRGQDYFVTPANPSTLSGYLHPIFPNLNAPPPAVSPMFLRADPAGGVSGAASFGQSLFRYSPSTPSQWINTNQTVNTDGEIYDGRWYNGKFYFVCYAGGEIGMWDPALPWDQYNGVNPKVLQPSGYIRPQGGMVQQGSTHKFYSGWSGPYSTLTGGLTEYDPATNSVRRWDGSLFDPNGVAVSMGTVAADNNYIYGVTSNDFNGNGSPNPPAQTFWMAQATASGITVMAKVPLGVNRGASCFYVPGTNRVWVALPTGLRLFNTGTKTLGPVLPWPAQCAYAAIMGKFDTMGSNAWIDVGSTLVQLHDGPYPWLEPLFYAEDGINGVAAHPTENTLYTSSSIDLYATPVP